MTLPRHRHTAEVTSAAFSPDGQTIVASDDTTVRLWDVSAALNTGVETGAAIRTLAGHTAWVTSVAFSPDGQTIVTASDDGTARLWVARIEDLLALAESLIQREPPIFTPEERLRFGLE